MTAIDLVIIVMGTAGMTELVRHDPRLQEWRAKLTSSGSRPGWFRQLLNCGFCLSHWAAIVSTLAYLLIPFGYVIITILAAVRAANIINDVLHAWNRSPVAYDFNPMETENAVDGDRDGNE